MDELLQFKQTYFQECDELLADLEEKLMALEEGNYDPEILHAVFRAIHSVKGGAGAFGFERLVNFAHGFETVLDLMRDGRLQPDEERVGLLIRTADVLSDLVRGAREENELPPGYEDELGHQLAALAIEGGAGTMREDEVVEDFDDIDFEPVPVDLEEVDGQPEEEEEVPPPPPQGEKVWRIRFTPHADVFQHSNEPLLIFRELQELGTVRVDPPDLSSLPPLEELDPGRCYLSWTLSVEGKASREQIRDVFEFASDDCELEVEGDEAAQPAPPPEPEPEPEPQPAAKHEAPAEPAAAPAPAAPRQAPPAAKAGAEHGRKPGGGGASVRVDLDKIDRLVNMVGELVITQAMLAQEADQIPPEEYPGMIRGLDQLFQHTRELQDSVMAIRAQPVKSVFARMPRLVRELAQATGKKVRLSMSGENTEIDKTVIEQLGDPITHMIRNSVDHGLEGPEDRIAAGKPAEGTIFLAAEHRGGKIVIEIADDGRGIDRDRVLQKAIEKGLVQPGQQLTDEEIDNIIFMPGFSTAAEVSNISGRGVGMDVVKRNIESLGGRVLVQSTPGHGSVFTMTLPLTLAILDGMTVRLGRERYVLPLSNIIESFKPQAKEIHSRAGSGDMIHVRGEYVPLVYLHRLFGVADAIKDPCKALVVLVETEGGKKVGLIVDEILGQQQVVIKSLEENFDPVEGVAAATILGDGKVALILDVAGLKAMAERGRPRHAAPASRHAAPEADAQPEPPSRHLQLISFDIGNEKYGVDIMSIREIRAWSETTAVPNSPPYVRGVINLRGTIVPIFDLRARCGMGLTRPTPTHVVIIVKAASRTVGILVDAVSDILTLSREDVRPVPDMENTYLDGLIPVGDRMVALIAFDRLFDPRMTSFLEGEADVPPPASQLAGIQA